MMSILYFIFSFIVAISILVAIHEYGHYIVAKKLGVKILRFSIGFGKPLWKKCFGKDQTEFVIAALPLGGYVKMLDKRESEVAADEAHREFTSQSVWTRIAIVAAGPAFNFLFAIFAYWMMFVVGVSGIKPVIGNVDVNGLAQQSGLVSGYEIVSVNGNKTPIWDVAVINLMSSIVDRSKTVLELKDKNGNTITRYLDFSKTTGEIKVEKLFKQLGFKPWRPAVQPIVGTVVKDTPAEHAGFKVGDKILKVNNITTPDWSDVVDIVSGRPSEVVQIDVLRDGKHIKVQAIPKKIKRKGETVGQLGLGPKSSTPYPKEMRVTHGFDMVDSIPRAFSRTWEYTVLNLKMMGKFVTGEISLKNLSGPVSIAQYAGYSASAGLSRFLSFLALVSISLGILNLLPIPILDGGHLMYYMVEVVRRKPVSEETQEYATRIGLILLLALMSIAFYNDILRVFS